LSWIIFQRKIEEFSQEINGMQFHRTQENVAEEGNQRLQKDSKEILSRRIFQRKINCSKYATLAIQTEFFNEIHSVDLENY
jgi:hypothetical protein